MNTHTIVVLDAITVGNASAFDIFKSLGNLTVYNTTTKEERISHIQNADIVITNIVVITKEVIDACPSIRLICLTATVMNNVDLPYAEKKGIIVKNVAGYSTESVAQHTFALTLSYLHHTQYYANFVQSGAYSQSGLFTHIGPGYWELQGKTWGIIGLGAIGRRVAEIAKAFRCTVQYVSTSNKNHTNDYPQRTLQELLQSSDIISIHAPLNENTHNLIGKKEFSYMQSHALLINVGRGGIINEPALAQALRKNQIAGACIDVMGQEPLPANSPLLADDIADKILITPHLAWISKEAISSLLKKVYANVQTYIEEYSY